MLPSTDCNGNLVLDECETPNPSTVGACCVNESCSEQTESSCDAAGGVYFGSCISCSEIALCPGPGYVDLDFNWNGVVHPGETNKPDDPDGYRSIADSLGGTSGIVTRGDLTYYLQMLSFRPDCIHIGHRQAYDATIDGDHDGIAPAWDPSDTGDGTNVSSSTSMFAPSPVLNSGFELGVLYHASHNGGNFDMTLGFTDSSSVTVTLNAPDWFALFDPRPSAPGAGVATQAAIIDGPLSCNPNPTCDGFYSAGDVDNGNPDQPLDCMEATITAGSLSSIGFNVSGKQLNSITFNNWTSGDGFAGNAIFAASYYAPATACSCPGDVSGDNMIDGADVQGFVDCLLGGGGDCSCADLDGMNGPDVGDIADFVTNLLTVGPACP